jgi:hypothetical protein
MWNDCFSSQMGSVLAADAPGSVTRLDDCRLVAIIKHPEDHMTLTQQLILGIAFWVLFLLSLTFLILTAGSIVFGQPRCFHRS